MAKLTLLILETFVMLLLVFYVVRVMLRKSLYINKEKSLGFLVAYAVRFSAHVIGLTINMLVSQKIFIEQLGAFFTPMPTISSIKAIQFICVFTIFPLIWFFGSIGCAQIIGFWFFGKRIDLLEVEANNFSYLFIKGIFLLVFTVMFVPALEISIRFALPILYSTDLIH